MSIGYAVYLRMLEMCGTQGPRTYCSISCLCQGCLVRDEYLMRGNYPYSSTHPVYFKDMTQEEALKNSM